MAEIYAKNGKQDKVEEMFNEAFRALGKDAAKSVRAQSKVIISRARFAIGMKEKGVQMLEQANVKIPEPGGEEEPAPFYNVLIGVGVLKARQGDYQGALDVAKKLEDSNAAVLFEVALSMVRNKAPLNDANKALLKSFMQKAAPKEEAPAEK
jgi:tetratricopeptide (TPR) repeat protein